MPWQILSSVTFVTTCTIDIVKEKSLARAEAAHREAKTASSVAKAERAVAIQRLEEARKATNDRPQVERAAREKFEAELRAETRLRERSLRAEFEAKLAAERAAAFQAAVDAEEVPYLYFATWAF